MRGGITAVGIRIVRVAQSSTLLACFLRGCDSAETVQFEDRGRAEKHRSTEEVCAGEDQKSRNGDRVVKIGC